ncbi:MAG: 30S ribosomal protein S17 [Rhodospirillaceae bacterium]|jgi:small subunit ribosomal protein S17|nr:30S ribosomal protein S17 [Rhodospirillaceae bacterium]MBT6403025.1 30S ribosomal protein S17 [Rhodospirillaceae bacterium]MBT6537333.1 30S ribosomal protein S17 [Rhodospirillaceae bacterium]MBT7361611.1 30S ribosomal protein S17 [Rhodospirillaceae bacterium]
MPRRVLTGTVVSNKMDKSVTVRVDRRVRHPIYKKFMTQSKKIAAHDAENSLEIGDVVRIRECRPISKSKHFEVIEKVGA